MGLFTDTSEPEGSEGVLEVLLSLLLGLNTPEARSLHDSFAMQSSLLLLLRDLLLEGGTPPPDNLLHLIARMQKKHQRRLRHSQRAASRQQHGDRVAPLYQPPSTAPQQCPDPEESPLQGCYYVESVLHGTSTGAPAVPAPDLGMDSRGTSEDDRGDHTRSRPA